MKTIAHAFTAADGGGASDPSNSGDDAAPDYWEQAALLNAAAWPRLAGLDAAPAASGVGAVYVGFDLPAVAAGNDWPKLLEPATPYGPVALPPPAAGSGEPSLGALGVGASDTGGTSSGAFAASAGLHLNLVFDAQARAAPQSFRDGMQAAANLLEAALADPITVNIQVGFGEFDGDPIDPDVSEGGFFSVAESYSTLRGQLAARATSAQDTSSVNALPNTASIQGHSTIGIGRAEAKAFGVVNPTNGAIDGIVGMGADFTGNVLIEGALHEITHAMGRAGGAQNLFRFTSAGTRLFTNNIPSAAAYFSVDGGVSRLANFGQDSDPFDFLNDSLAPDDSFDEFVTGRIATLTDLDRIQMDVLGFTLAGVRSPSPPVPVSSLDTMKAGDFDHGGTSDVITLATDGTLTIFATANGVAGQPLSLGRVGTEQSFGAVGNFFGVGSASDFILRGPQGDLGMYQVQNNRIVGFHDAGGVGTEFQIVSVGDYFQSGTDDFMMRNTTSGLLQLYHEQAGQIVGANVLGAVGTENAFVGQGNFVNNGTLDFLMEQSGTGLLSLYQVRGGQIVGFSSLGAMGGDEHVVGIGDFNGDHISDALVRRDDGLMRIYEFQSGQVSGVALLGAVGLEWQSAGVGNFFGNGADDFLMRDGTAVELYKIQNYQVAGASPYGQFANDTSIAGAYFNHLV